MRKAKRKGQRVLAAALCVGMLASMVPAQAFANDEPITAIVQQEDTPADADAPAEDTNAGQTPAPTEAPAASETETPAGKTPDEAPDAEETPTPTETPAETETPAPTEAPAADETPAPATTIQESGDADSTVTTTHIATKVGEVPAVLADVDGVTADTFKTAFETVKVQKGDVTYTVEVIPADTVYFIDSVAASGNNGAMDSVKSTEAYAAAKALLGDRLLNGKSDQFYQGDATWGLVDNDAQTKGYNGITSDKTYTGVYGQKNEKGETISYKFTLPAGKYSITTAHREWWKGQNRAMDLSLTTSDGASVYASVPKQDNGKVTTKTGEFTITTEQVVTWTATATGQHAPAVSWLAVERTGDVETPDTPDENENFGKALEDDELVTVRNGASLTDTITGGKQVSVTSGWINGGNSAMDGGAAVKEADSFFKRSSFTLYADIKFNDAHDNTSAILVGPAADAHFRIIPRKTDGTAVLKVNNNQEYELSQSLEAGEWNALALVYNENDTEGTVAVYLNGEEVLPATGVGFKLSEKTGIIGAFGATFGTGFMRTGLYDNIVVTGKADADAAKIETASRKEAFDGIVDVDGIVTLNGSEVEAAAKNVNGWTYKGLGMLNGNATSNLLLDYKAENPQAYWAMMQYLFGSADGYPLFSNIKMEMGNDGNNSTGAEACTMRYENEEADASRSPGFVMAADAKKINPNVKVSILRWEYPNWVKAKADGDEKYAAIYKWYKETIFDAYEKYGYVIDYIDPDKNETQNPDGEIIKYFANALKNEGDFPVYFTEEAIAAYHNIKIVASDENKTLNIVPLMLRDSAVYDAVDAIGFHYRTNATDDYIKMADVNDKEVWYSEGCATFGYSELQENKTTEYGANTIGGYQSPLALLDSIPNAFVGSRRTMYMFQPAIGSFYEGIQYGHKELLSARDPWSGYIHYDPALYMLAHITQFAKTGWENDTNTNGIWRVLPNATFASFGASDNEHATAGIDGSASYMTLAAPDKKDFSTVFINNTQNEKTFAIKVADDMDISVMALHVWTTVTDSYLQKGEDAAIENGIATITVPAYSVVTATTLDTTPARFPTEKDDGDYIQTGTRSVLDTDSTGKNADTTDEYLYADNFEYVEEGQVAGYNVTTGEETLQDYIVSRGNEPRYMLDTHGAWIVEGGRLKQENESGVNQWNSGDPATIVGDWRWMDYSASIDVTLPNAEAGRYERLTIRAQTGMNWNNSGYTLEINGAGSWKLFRIGTQVANGTVAKNAEGKYNLKLTGLGSTVYAYINDVRVAKYNDANPMLSGRVKISSNWKQVYADNLEVKTVKGGIPYATAMIDGQDDGVKYEGNWTINNPGGGSADNWYRTISSSSTADASFTFTANGNGFAIMGGNDGSAVIDVYVDGQLKAENAATKAAPTRGETYILSDLAAGNHTIKVVLKSGTLKVDALNTIGARLESVSGSVTEVLTELPTMDYYVTGSGVSGLPDEVEVKLADGTTDTRDVEWNVDEDALAANAYSSGSINGNVKDAVNSLGEQLTVSVNINEVIPGDTLYFIDSVSGKITDVAGGTTETYKLYKKALGGLLMNDAFDQFKTDATTWGLVDTDAGTKGYSSTADKTATGIYGHDNKAGETLTYALTLPAGTYTLTSAHREWWSMTRPMTAVVTDTEGTALSDTADLNLSGSSGDIINKADFTLDKEQVVYYTVTATGTQAPVISWLAVNGKTAQSGSKFFDQVLEDNGGLTLAANAATLTDETWGTILKVSTQWNNKNEYHAAITDGQNLFGRTQFTLLADVMIEKPGSDASKTAMRSAFTISTGSNRLHLLTYDGKVGYGVDGSNAGISKNEISLGNVAVGTWNSVAFVYNEPNGGNGSLTVYLNGKKAGEIADIGFKLSESKDIAATVARNVGTNYLLTGQYDNIVVKRNALSESAAVKETAARYDAKNPSDAARAALAAKIEEIRAALAADEANGITYATEKLENWQYTGNKAGTADTLPEMNEALTKADTLAADETAATDELNSCVKALDAQYKALRTLPETYTDIPGTAATVIKADTGLPMQAHGGSAMTLKEGTGDGCVNYDLDGDGSITEGKTVYLWFGEDKTNNTRPVDGVRCYSSTDLYNWTDHGTILYTQSTILPIEEGTEKAITSSVGANGTGTTQKYNVMQCSKTNLETLKAWGKLSTAPEGVTESEFRNVRNFLRAYVTEYEKAPTDLNDISWTAKTYGEEPITATSLLYPDSTDGSVRNVTTTRLQLAFETLYGSYCITERPKMIYNESTKQFVLLWHADGPLYNSKDLSGWVAGGCVGNCPASRYSRAMVGIATSDSPFGPFTVQNVTRMNYDATLNANRLGEARDMTVFVDTGVDKNNDGADDAYVIYSSEMNAKLYVSLLNKDYTGLAAEADQADDTQFAARIVTDNSREAPAMFKYGGYYYLITSGTDGWNSTAHIYYRSKNVLSGWEKIGNPAKNDTGKMFNTQVTYVLPVDAENGKFIYMADRWNGSNLTDSRTIWLPIQMNTDSTLSVLGEKNWTLDRLDQLLPTTVNTELPKVVWSDGSNLPKTVNVTTQGKDVTSKVEWDTDSLKNFGTVSITGTLTECNNISISTTATVVPKNLLYFANPTKTPVSSDYTAIVNASAETLKNSAVNDGAYNAENGFGYTGTAGTLRNTNADIYESMRYAANKDSITYRFDNLTGSGYTVYVGMFNPTGWVENGKVRLADIKINGETVQTGYNYNTSCTGKGDTLAFTGLSADENGTLTVEIAANANTTSAVQVSFIMVAGTEKTKPEPTVTPNPTTKPDPTPAPTTKPTATPEPTAKPTATPAPTTAPTATPEPTAKPTATPAPTTEPTATPEPTVKPTETPAPTVKPTETPAPTAKPTETPAPTTAPTATPAPTVKPTATPAPTAAPVKTEVIKEELTADNISQELQDKGFTTSEKVKSALKEEIAKEQPAEDGKTEFYEVTLRIKNEDGTIGEEVTKENFPQEGLEVAFDLPNDIKAEEADNYDFLIAHLKNDGNTELLKPALKDGKLVVTVHSLSPFAVSWKAKEQPAPTEKPTPAPTEKPTATPAPTSKPNSSNSNNSNSTSNGAAGTAKPSQATPAPASTTRVPQTSDSFPIVPLAAVALLSLNGLIVLILRKREQKHK